MLLTKTWLIMNRTCTIINMFGTGFVFLIHMLIMFISLALTFVLKS